MGIWAHEGGSVELTGCSLRGNGRDYFTLNRGTITADGRRVG